MTTLSHQWNPQDGQPPSGSVQLAMEYDRQGAVAVIGREIVTPSRPRFLAHAGAAGVVAGKGGAALYTDGAASSYFDLGKLPKANNRAMTWVVQFSTLAAGGPDYLSSTVNTGTSYIEDLLVNSDNEVSSAGSLQLLIRDDAGVINTTSTGNIGVNDGRVHTVVWQMYGGVVFDCWVDGVKRTLTGGGTTATSSGDTEFPIWLFTRNLRNVATGGSDATQRIFLYVRTPAMVPGDRISANPWLLFDQIQDPFWYGAAVGGSFNAAWAIAANSVIQGGAIAA